MVKTNDLDKKINALKEALRGMKKVAVAYSAGVDSTFLLNVASEVLAEQSADETAENVVAVTVVTESFPSIERRAAEEFLRAKNIKALTIEISQFNIDGFSENTPERCYICKKNIFVQIKRAAAELGIDYVLDGTNVDDDKDYRPGQKALAELGVVSPLKDAGMTKADIREASRLRGLATWDKPAYACLATRIETGTAITPEDLAVTERAEAALTAMGFREFRVRKAGNTARIEVADAEWAALAARRQEILRTLGPLYTHVTVDLEGRA